ncbi:MAG: sensor histidine kinase [Sporolactobacillus sp.]
MNAILYMSLTLSFISAIYCSWGTFSYPDIGLRLNNQNHRVIVETVEPQSWAAQHFIHSGDQVVLIDDHSAAQNMTANKNGYLYRSKTLAIIGQSGMQSYVINNKRTFIQVLFSFVIPVLFFISCISLAGLILKRKENISKEQSLLFIFLITIAPLFLEISANHRIGHWIIYPVEFSMTMSLALLAHFLITFFHLGHSRVNYYLISILYAGSAIAVLLDLVNTRITSFITYSPLFVYSFFEIGLIVWLLARLFVESRGEANEKTVKFLLFGFLLAFLPFIVFFVLPRLVFGQGILSWQWTTPFFLLVPLTLGYLVLSKALVDVDFIIGRLFYYGAISLVGTGFMTVYYILCQATKRPLNDIRFSLLAFITLLLFLYAKEYIDFYLRDFLFPARKDYQDSIGRVLRTAKQGYRLRDLIRVMKQELEHNLPVENVILREIKANSPLSQRESDAENKTMPAAGRLMEFRTNDSGFSVLLFRDGKISLVLSGEWSRPRLRLNIEEKLWLEMILSNAQILIENLYKAVELIDLLDQKGKQSADLPVTVKKVLFHVADRERQRLARDLHDTTVQNLLALARDIDSEQEKYKDSLYKSQLGMIRQRVLGNTHELRRVIRDLYPEVLQMSTLGHALLNLVAYVENDASFSIHPYIEDGLEIDNIDLKTAIYRVIQELLSNAVKHALAKNVTLILAKQENYYELLYDDDGIGTDKEMLDRSFSTMGIPGIIGRVESMGGTIEIQSKENEAPNKGFHVAIIWPMP